jgi:hypothetical protein
VRLPGFLFPHTSLIFLLRLCRRPSSRLGRIGRMLDFVFFVIIEL